MTAAIVGLAEAEVSKRETSATNTQPGRRLDLFRRQLAAAFGHAAERQPQAGRPIRNSLKFQKSAPPRPPQDDKSSKRPVQDVAFGNLRARSLESREQKTSGGDNLANDFVSSARSRLSPRHYLRRSASARKRGNGAAFSSNCKASETAKRKQEGRASSPRHLIRMFAEHREDSMVEPTGCKSLVSYLLDSAAHPIKFAKTIDWKTTTPSEHAERATARSPGVVHNSNAPTNTSPRREPDLTANDRHQRHQPTKSRLGASSFRSWRAGASKAERLQKLLDELASERGPGRGATLGNYFLNFSHELELVKARASALASPACPAASDESLRSQQEAILELLSTELNYLKQLNVICELFLGTLELIKRLSGLLDEVDSCQVISNVEQIYDAHCALWIRHFRPLLLGDTENLSLSGEQDAQIIDPGDLGAAFANVSRSFKPYYRFCVEQASCVSYIKSASARSDCFRLYLGWCESQLECDRMRLIDLLAYPMQRLTRYPLLLRTILRRTNKGADAQSGPDEQREALARMIALVDKFVLTVDLELKRRDEFVKLCAISDRLAARNSSSKAALGGLALNQDALPLYGNHEVQNLLSSYLFNFNSQTLMLPLLKCPFPACQRQLLFDSSPIKFKDPQAPSKLDVIVLILTDQLLVCRRAQGQARTSNASNKLTGTRSLQSSRRRTSNYHLYQVDNGGDDGDEPASSASLSMGRLNLSQSQECRGAGLVHQNSGEPNDASTGNGAGTGIEEGGLSPVRKVPESSPAEDFNFLSPSRALREMSGRQFASSQDLTAERPGTLNVLAVEMCGARRPSVSTCGTPTSERNSKTYPAQNYLSPTSSANFEFSWPLTSKVTGDNGSLDGSAAASCKRQAPPVSARGEQRRAGMGKNQHASAGGSRVELRLIRSPYPIERLVAHELSDGRSVLLCQLNDTHTVASSFVLHFPKHTGAAANAAGAGTGAAGASAHSRSAEERTPGKAVTKLEASRADARRLIQEVHDAQLRYQAQAKLHGHNLRVVRAGDASSARQEAAALVQPKQQAARASLSVESSPARLGVQRTSVELGAHNSDDDRGDMSRQRRRRMAQLVAEQHQLFLLSHGRREELATHDFAYELLEHAPALDFRVLARPLAGPNQPSRSVQSSNSPSPSPAASAAQQRPGRPQLGRSARVLYDHGACTFSRLGGRSISHSSLSLESLVLTTSFNDASESNATANLCDISPLSQRQQQQQQHMMMTRRYARLANASSDRSADSERDAKSICSQPSYGGMAAAGSVSRQSSLRTRHNNPNSSFTDNGSLATASRRSSRRNLSSLRRQNVVLSVSCEQQAPSEALDALGAAQNSSTMPLDKRLLHASARKSQFMQAHRARANPQTYDSSSIDSTNLASLTDDSFKCRSQRSFLRRGRYESSSVQTTTTLDQTTFDETSCPGEQGDEISRLAFQPFEFSTARQSPSRLQSIRSVSTDQTSSPIAVTLTVPSRAGHQDSEASLSSAPPSGAITPVGDGPKECSDPVQVSDSGDNCGPDRTDAPPANHRVEPRPSWSNETRRSVESLVGCLDIRALRLHERAPKSHGGSAARSPRHSSAGPKHGVRSRLVSIMDQLHLWH